MRPKRSTTMIIVAVFIILFLGWIALKLVFSFRERQAKFDGERAIRHVEEQIAFGPRIPGTEGHRLALAWMEKSLIAAGWETEIQSGEMMGQPIHNLIAKRGMGRPWVILGAHYDTRIFADRDPDPDKRTLPVPGANDAASGVAVLLELGRVLPDDFPGQIWLVFFDAEDNGDIPGWDWILGSRYFVDHLEADPDAAVIIDMIGDASQNIFIERNSDLDLALQIWGQAAALGYADHFIPIPKFSLIDDHSPFLWAGIPAVDIIDFDYPYWHTVDDTPDKVSAKSLQVVGNTLLAWLEAYLTEGFP